jgi:NAD(P)-dependent dehydrogenase (short-subunit alcohol dehydrogenase family)
MSRVLVTASADGLVRAAAQKLLADGVAMVVYARSTKRAEALDLSPQSTQYAEALIEDYAERTKSTWFSSASNLGIAAGALIGVSCYPISASAVPTSQVPSLPRSLWPYS